MSRAPLTKTDLMTAEEFYGWADRPENEDKWFELVRGEVIELPNPTIKHDVVTANTVRILGHASTCLSESRPQTPKRPGVAAVPEAATGVPMASSEGSSA